MDRDSFFELNKNLKWPLSNGPFAACPMWKTFKEELILLDIVLYQPEIPPNTGNIIRLCANTGFHLHIIEPMGFDLDDKKLRRARLDYREFQGIRTYKNWTQYRACTNSVCYAFSTKGTCHYSTIRFNAGDQLLFGSETRGLPIKIHEEIGSRFLFKIPMISGSRSLNLSNAVAIVAYEAWRQLEFANSQKF